MSAETWRSHVQGNLARAKMLTPLGPPWDPRHRPTAGSYTVGGCISMSWRYPCTPRTPRHGLGCVPRTRNTTTGIVSPILFLPLTLQPPPPPSSSVPLSYPPCLPFSRSLSPAPLAVFLADHFGQSLSPPSPPSPPPLFVRCVPSSGSPCLILRGSVLPPSPPCPSPSEGGQHVEEGSCHSALAFWFGSRFQDLPFSNRMFDWRFELISCLDIPVHYMYM